MPKWFYAFAFITFALQIFAYSNEPVENVFLSDTADLSIASSLNTQITKVVDLMSSCMKAGKSNADCLCQNKTAISALNNQLNMTLAKRPDWKSKTLNLKSQSKQSLIIDIPGLIKQSKIPPCGN